MKRRTIQKLKIFTIQIALIVIVAAISLFSKDSAEETMAQEEMETIENEESNDNDHSNSNSNSNDLDNVVETEEDKEEKDVIINVPVVVATSDVNIRDNINGNILGVLPEGKDLELVEKVDDTHYKVLYYGETAYVSANYVTESSILDINKDIIKMFYATEDKTLYIPGDLSETGEDEYKNLPKYECLEVYEEIDDYYLVQTSDYVGYVTKDNLQELQGTFVNLDISDQNLKLYEDNKIILEAPVITGKPKTPTRIGSFQIHDITYNRYLVGINDSYRAYVDVMMKFDKNIGLHDAEYHTDENGKHHGWREASQMGGSTYITDGSHGCVNMKHDDAMAVSKHVKLKTQVIVQE